MLGENWTENTNFGRPADENMESKTRRGMGHLNTMAHGKDERVEQTNDQAATKCIAITRKGTEGYSATVAIAKTLVEISSKTFDERD
jgi:hypothetical protein